jgi:hypothetical protein
MSPQRFLSSRRPLTLRWPGTERRALPGDPLAKVCGKLLMLRGAHRATAGAACLVGMLILFRVYLSVRRGTRALPHHASCLRKFMSALLVLALAGWWVYWYSDLPYRLQGFSPTFYTVRATLWPTTCIGVSFGLSVLVAALILVSLSPRVPRESN